MYQRFWNYAIFIILVIVSTLYLANHCMSPEFGAVMVFLAYLVIAYIVANSIRTTILYIDDEREKSIRLSFDCLVGLFLVVTGYFKYAKKILGLPEKVISSGITGIKKVGKVVGV